jgi:hypothetical protein
MIWPLVVSLWVLLVYDNGYWRRCPDPSDVDWFALKGGAPAECAADPIVEYDSLVATLLLLSVAVTSEVNALSYPLYCPSRGNKEPLSVENDYVCHTAIRAPEFQYSSPTSAVLGSIAIALDIMKRLMTGMESLPSASLISSSLIARLKYLMDATGVVQTTSDRNPDRDLCVSLKGCSSTSKSASFVHGVAWSLKMHFNESSAVVTLKEFLALLHTIAKVGIPYGW